MIATEGDLTKLERRIEAKLQAMEMRGRALSACFDVLVFVIGKALNMEIGDMVKAELQKRVTAAEEAQKPPLVSVP